MNNLIDAWVSKKSNEEHPLFKHSAFRKCDIGFLVMPAHDTAFPLSSSNMRSHLTTMSIPILKQIKSNIEKEISKIHQHGLVHNDLTPENMLIDPETLKVYLIDFGGATVATNDHLFEMESRRALGYLTDIITAKESGKPINFDRIFGEF